jgi:hypothetical protein
MAPQSITLFFWRNIGVISFGSSEKPLGRETHLQRQGTHRQPRGPTHLLLLSPILTMLSSVQITAVQSVYRVIGTHSSLLRLDLGDRNCFALDTKRYMN